MVVQAEVGGFWRRGIGLIVDGFVGLVFQVPAIVVVVAGPTELGSCGPEGGLCEQPTSAAGVAGALLLVGGALAWMILHAGLTSTAGGSPGKLLLGLRVVRVDGRRLSRWVAFGRLLATYLSSQLFALGYLFALTNRHRETFHDRLAKTRVLRDERRWPWTASSDLRRSLAAYSITLALSGALVILVGVGGTGPSEAALAAVGSQVPAGDAGTAVSTVPYGQLATGDCVTADPDQLAASEVVVIVDCGQRHVGEVVGRGELAAGSWPGEDVAFEASLEVCSDAFFDHTGTDWWRTVLDLRIIGPQDEAGWNLDRDVLCVAYTPEPTTSALTDTAVSAWPGLVSSDAAAPGTCADIVDQLPGPLVVLDCNQPHDIEVLPEGPIELPDFDEIAVEVTADGQCRRLFADYVGIPYDASTLDMSYTAPTTRHRFVRHPVVRCFIETPDVLGSVRASQR